MAARTPCAHQTVEMSSFSWQTSQQDFTCLIYQPPIQHRETATSSLSRGRFIITCNLLHKFGTKISGKAPSSLSTSTYKQNHYLHYLLGFVSVFHVRVWLPVFKVKEVFQLFARSSHTSMWVHRGAWCRNQIVQRVLNIVSWMHLLQRIGGANGAPILCLGSPLLWMLEIFSMSRLDNGLSDKKIKVIYMN